MGSDETAITIPGGPRVIAYLTVTGCHRDQIIYFFGMQIGSQTPSGIGLRSGTRLDRMRRILGPSESSGSHCQAIHGFLARTGERIGRLCPEPGRMRCRRLHVYSFDPRRPQGDLFDGD